VPPLEGRLFFDMNGSGLPDEATFNYDPARLADPRQPLQPDLKKSIDDYVSAHPDLKNGDLITIEEPGLSGYTVCVQADCVQTDQQGNFSLPNPSGASGANIKITDPNADNPALAMRYINDWKGPVVVPAYTKDVDAATMARLTTIPGCDIDLAALVCKLDDTTLQVRDQHLNDTGIIPIGNGISIKLGEDNNVGLMQGFLTLPFVKEQVPEPYIDSYFDIIGSRIFNDNISYADTMDGIVLNYDGQYSIQNIPHLHITGVGDSHTGIDYFVPEGNWIISGAPTSRVWYLTGPDELRVNLMFQIPENPGNDYDNCYGHLAVQLVEMDQPIYRGQIVGLSGNTGIYYPPPRPPMLHFHVGKAVEGGGW
jgi:murein DD-endopeptidase MepM/ murein hydrolase activator NlpD